MRPKMNPNLVKGKRFELRISEKELQKLEECATVLNISKSQVVTKAVDDLHKKLGTKK